MKTIAYIPSARRAYRKLPKQARERIADALERYAASGQGDVTRIKHGEGARLRVGDYRVIFVETASAIEVRAVGHRREIYR